jgi:hypothetical protein
MARHAGRARLSPRARRIAIVLAALALALSLGRWGSLFLADRLWEATVSEPVAAAGSRRALLALGLELSVILLSVAWFIVHFTIARRAALPDQPPPEREHARLWPDRLPRWFLTATAVVFGVLLGSGAETWLDEVLLTLDGVRLGVPDPLLGADLGVFLRDFPLWMHLQARATLLCGAALLGVVLLYIAGGALRIVDRRLWVSSRARGHLAILLAFLGLTLAWGSVLEPFRLAAGLRGPLLSSEFLLRTLVAEVEAGLGAAAAVVSFFWWLRIRGAVAFGVWMLYGLAVLAGRVLPLRTEAAINDEGWRASARALDSVAFGLAAVEGNHSVARIALSQLVPSLWDPPMVSAIAGDSAVVLGASKGWIPVGEGKRRPVWLIVRQVRDQAPSLLAVADDEVSPAGGPLAWSQGDNAPAPGSRVYRELSFETLRPGAPRITWGSAARGVELHGWPKRLMLAWALQAPAALSAPAGSRFAWRLDPGIRLRSIAPFAQWSAPRPQVLDGELVWTSDGLLTASNFPASTRLTWAPGNLSMMRPAFLGIVDATSGGVRIFRRNAADSLSAAWARIAAPLIEPATATPPGVREREPYPEELLLTQARVVQGPAWNAGQLERSTEATEVPPPASAGGTEVLAPFVTAEPREVAAFLQIRRTGAGDSLHLLRIDTLRIESPTLLTERWKRFPFQGQLKDSVTATDADFHLGQVRYVLAEEGFAAYQPAWAVAPSGRAQLVLVNVALMSAASGRRVGAGRTMQEAWLNLRGQISPTAIGTGAEATLEQARLLMLRADSALKRGDLQGLGRALAYLLDLLNSPR